jgi:hypothetical protein
MPQYHNAPITARTPTELAINYGYISREACLSSIPENARVMDVGAGLSSFGRFIARNREDVTVVNFDYAYYDSHLRRELDKKSPGNLEHVPLDIVKGPVAAWRGDFDTGYSFWLLPHLSLEKDITPASKAASNMLAMMKLTGELRVGPTRGFLNVFGCCVEVDMTSIKSEQDRTNAVSRLVADTRRNGSSRKFYLMLNTLSTQYVGVHVGQ